MNVIIRHPVLALLAGIVLGALVISWGKQTPVEFAAAVPLHDKGVSTFYVDGEVDGLGKVEFLVDTGAGYTTINEETLATLQSKSLARYSRELEGVLADGRRMQVSVYRISNIALGDCELRDVEAAVFPGSTRFLLGMNALRQAAPFAFVTEPKPHLALGRCSTQSSF